MTASATFAPHQSCGGNETRNLSIVKDIKTIEVEDVEVKPAGDTLHRHTHTHTHWHTSRHTSTHTIHTRFNWNNYAKTTWNEGKLANCSECMQLFTINKVKIVKSGSEDRPRWLASALWGTWPQPPNADGRHGSCGTMWQVLQDPNIPRPSGLCGRKLRHLTFVAYWIACKSVLALTAVSGMVSGMVFKNILFIYFPIFSHNRNIWLTWLICDLLEVQRSSSAGFVVPNGPC